MAYVLVHKGGHAALGPYANIDAVHQRLGMLGSPEDWKHASIVSEARLYGDGGSLQAITNERSEIVRYGDRREGPADRRTNPHVDLGSIDRRSNGGWGRRDSD